MNILIAAAATLCAVALGYVLIAGFGGLVRLVSSLTRLAGYAETRQNSPHKRTAADDAIPISILLPDCDNDLKVTRTVNMLLAQDYPEFEVIAVCNGKRSGSLARLVQAFDMVPVEQPIRRVLPMGEVRAVYRSARRPNLIVLDRAQLAYSDALNTGVNVARYPLFITLVAGSVLPKNQLEKVAAPFALSHKVVALGGLPRMRSPSRKPHGTLGWLQQADFLRSYPADFAIPEDNRLRLIPGAYGAFRKAAVVAEGGFTPGCEETEMVARLHRSLSAKGKEHSIGLLPEPIAAPAAASRAAGFFKSHRRRQASLMQALWDGGSVSDSTKERKASGLDKPYYWFFEVLGPVLELLGCLLIPVSFALGWVGPELFWAFLFTEVLLGMLVSLAALLTQEFIDSDKPDAARLRKLILAAIVSNLGYRQLVLVFRLIGMLDVSGKRPPRPPKKKEPVPKKKLRENAT